MTDKEVDNLFRLTGVPKNIYLFIITDKKILQEDFIHYAYHIKGKFMEKMNGMGIKPSEASIKRAMRILVVGGFLKKGERRNSYFLL